MLRVRESKFTPYLYQLPSIHFKRTGIPLAFYLLQRLFHRTIQLKFKDIDIILRLQNHIRTTIRGVVFRLDIKTHQSTDYKKNILIVPLYPTGQFIRYTIEKRLQATKETLRIAFAEIRYKVLQLKSCLTLFYGSIKKGSR